MVMMILLASPVLADVTGRASVIDGDMIEIAGERIRFNGMVAADALNAFSTESRPTQC